MFAQEPTTNAPAPRPAEQQVAPVAPQHSADDKAGTDKPAYLRVYRHRRYAGSALAPSIYIDDVQIARVGNGRRFSARLAPGSHTVRSDDKSSAIALDVKPGQEFYVRIDEETGFWKGHGKLTLLMPEQGKPEYSIAKPIEPDRKIAKDRIEEDNQAGAPAKEGAKN
jgi:hypothetical protein